MDVGLRHPAFGFGQMPHDFKSGTEEQRLPLLLRTEKRHPAAARLVKEMPDKQP